MRKRANRILATAEPAGNKEQMTNFVEVAKNKEVDALAILGDITGENVDPPDFASIFKIIANANITAFIVPGPTDAPFVNYLREIHNIELTFPQIHGVHGTFAFAPGYIVFAGMGGEIEDTQKVQREEISQLKYAGWEVDYRLRFLETLKEYMKIFLFTSFPAHKGQSKPGVETLEQLIKTHNPRLTIVRGDTYEKFLIGKSEVVSPGLLGDKSIALIDILEDKHEKINLE